MMRLVLGLMLGVLLGAQAAANEIFITERQQAALDRVLRPDGYITPDLHERFWNALPAEIRVEGPDREVFLATMMRTIASGARFQAELWRSAELSLAAGRVVHSANFAARREEAAQAARRQTGNREQFAAHIASSLGLADAMLQAAADGKPIVTRNGMIHMSPDRIAEILSGLDAALARLDILLDPVWSAPPRSRFEPEARLRISTPVPLVKGIERRKSRDGRDLITMTLTARHGEQDFVFLTYSEFAGPWRDAKKGMVKLAETALNNAGIAESGAQLIALPAANWQGRISATASGARTYTDQEGNSAEIYASARTISVPERNAVVTITSLTPRSARHAQKLQLQLESAIEIMP